jgi:uncharacterized protein YciI
VLIRGGPLCRTSSSPTSTGDPDGWARYLEAHVRWLIEQVESGRLRAAGPTTGTEVRSALLVLTAPDEKTLREVLDTDPYMKEGQVSELAILPWDPMFGAFANESSRANLNDTELLEQLQKTVR